MESNDIRGAQITMAYLEALVATPGGRTVFCGWAFDNDPDRWRAFAADKGREPSDPVLAQDCVLAAQAAVIEGSRCVLDKMPATLEGDGES
ncbi:MAG: hypothetical protein ABSB57_03230 [Dehalococcoidia bacterium]